ncbi:MAG: autoinducer synthase [Rhodobacteraceae bacterium]|nr:MAG: autoinducer synthase [Paracoccaceae bacterium]
MIKIVHAADLYRRPVLAASMFRDRALQFKDRLQWGAIETDDMGLEFDQYDELNPIYVIIEDENGQHACSARLLPTTGRTMLREHFSDLTGGVDISSPLIWEVTRLCLAPKEADGISPRRAPAALFWAGCDLALRSGVEFFVAVYFSHMQRVWKMGGFAPEVLGTRDTPDGEICCGLWEITPAFRDMLAERSGLAGRNALQYFPSEARFPAAPRFPADVTVSRLATAA